ncbi:uncharacterized protein YwqG [Kineosphaera limosa]|uniref:DUF1963 domain-containing protein n=1 Tax=Kineosphaera limosa NBRC 100340 TaxID=1184609 RepID=K6WV54_9MICO|nr:DUF1963 domain-containing protein [Kineosphaera limosa]NYE01581.1 uncharacterized protein YwqG [Kineosphaera limosa]GAB97726.1 hypothetical protein KILIM_079_00240 [Kineosphaera limosa NBRC 100340]
MTLIDRGSWQDVHDLAQRLLPSSVAQRWLDTVRQVVHLVPAGPGEPVLATLGGSPHLPRHGLLARTRWPTWRGSGPLSFVGELDLEALAESGLQTGLTLPGSGRLLMFFFDGSYDDFESLVEPSDPRSQAGARLLHLPEPRSACTPLAAPKRVRVDPEVALTGRQCLSLPDPDAPGAAALADSVDLQTLDELYTTLETWAVRPPRHQIGGWPSGIQTPPELEAAVFATGCLDWDDPTVVQDATQRRLLIQIDSTPTSPWGDAGTLYWLAPGTDASNPTSATFTWQSA